MQLLTHIVSVVITRDRDAVKGDDGVVRRTVNITMNQLSDPHWS